MTGGGLTARELENDARLPRGVSLAADVEDGERRLVVQGRDSFMAAPRGTATRVAGTGKVE